MGLVRRRPARWSSSWLLFPAGGDEANCLVDLGALAAAPVAGLDQRLTVHARLPVEAPPVVAAALSVVRCLDAEVAAAAHSRGGVLVARRLTVGAAEYTCYLPGEPAASPPLSVPSRVEAVPDPHWRHLREVLAPDDRQRRLADDLAVVAALAEHGDALVEPRPVEHVGYLPTAAAADSVAAELRADGFEVRVEAGDDGEYELLAVRRDGVLPPAVHALTERVRAAVVRGGGAYAGWNSVLLR